MPTVALDSHEVEYLAERDFRLRHLMRHVGDLDYTRPDSAFQSLAHSIIEQMLSMKAGRAIESRLRELCAGDYTPECIAGIPAENIKSCGMSLRKAQSLKTLAEYALANDLEALAELPDDEVYKTLVQLPGIGKWTCDMFTLFYLGRPDILPVEDGALRQAFEWLYGASIVSKEVQAVVCSLWHPHSSIAVRYLYRALNIGLLQRSSTPEFLWSACNA